MSNRLSIAIFAGAAACLALTAPIQAADSPETIDITAKQFAFAPNEIHLKAGQPAVLRLTSADVKHGFFSRPLGVDEIIPAGQSVDVNVGPAQPGTYTVICDHFCGAGHGNMKMTVVVE
jgi:cytochrome c oxidase subunit II